MRSVGVQAWWSKGTPEEVPGYAGILPCSYARRARLAHLVVGPAGFPDPQCLVNISRKLVLGTELFSGGLLSLQPPYPILYPFLCFSHPVHSSAEHET